MKSLSWLAGLLLLGLAGGRVQPPQQPLPAGGAGPALTVEEHTIVAAGSDRPDRFEYADLIPAEVLARRSTWRDASPAARLERANRVLAPFGYRLVPRPDAQAEVFDLYKGDQMAQVGLSHFRPVAVSDTGEDFVLLAEAGVTRTLRGPCRGKAGYFSKYRYPTMAAYPPSGSASIQAGMPRARAPAVTAAASGAAA